MKNITVTVDENTGEFEVDLTGFQGQGCDAIIEAFAEIGEATAVVHKPEWKATAHKQQTAGK